MASVLSGSCVDWGIPGVPAEHRVQVSKERHSQVCTDKMLETLLRHALQTGKDHALKGVCQKNLGQYMKSVLDQPCFQCLQIVAAVSDSAQISATDKLFGSKKAGQEKEREYIIDKEEPNWDLIKVCVRQGSRQAIFWAQKA